MARKIYEFKPDKEGPDLLSRLYLTKKQRQKLLKWSLYGLVLLGLSVLQDCMLSGLKLYGIATDLVPCAIIAICVLEGAESAAPFALVGSLLFSFSGGGAGFHTVALLTASAILASIFRQSFLQKGFSATVLTTGLGMTAYEMVTFGVALFFGQTFPGRWGIFLCMALLSTLVVSVLHPILINIGKIGGESWKE